MQAVGESGFAPTALAVHPLTGDLYVSVGGRGTRGGVYRIHYAGSEPAGDAAAVAALRPAARSLEWRPSLAPTLLAEATGSTGPALLGALEALRRHLGHVADVDLRRAIRAGWNDEDRQVRAATVRLLDAALRAGREPPSAKTIGAKMALAHCGVAKEPAAALALAAEVFAQDDVSLRLEGLALFQAAIGGRNTTSGAGPSGKGTRRGRGRNNCRRAQAEQPFRKLWESYPTDEASIDRELTRTAALLGSARPEVLRAVAARLTAASNPVDDFHHLAVLARLQAPRDDGIRARGRGAAGARPQMRYGESRARPRLERAPVRDLRRVG